MAPKNSGIRFSTFPRTEPPPRFTYDIVSVFRSHESAIGTLGLKKGLTSDTVLLELRDDLTGLGFEVEGGKRRTEKIERPVFYGENGIPLLKYEVDAFHPVWRCGLEVEAVRALRGGAVYRDLVQAMVMVQVDHLCIAVPNYLKVTQRPDRTYDDTIKIVEALYGHSRMQIPYGLTVIGY